MDTPMTREFTVDGTAQLVVEVPAGAVDIRDDAEPGRVTVTLDGEERVLAETRVEEAGGRVRVLVPRSGGRWSGLTGSRAVDARLVVPTGSALTITCESADVRASGRFGAVEVTTASGEVSVDTAAALVVQSASGDVRAGRVDGPARLSTASGDVELADVGGAVTARTASGDVRVGTAGGAVEASTASGDVEVGTAGAGGDRPDGVRRRPGPPGRGRADPRHHHVRRRRGGSRRGHRRLAGRQRDDR